MPQVREFFAEGKSFTIFVLRYTAFWLLYFLLCRSVFIFYHAHQTGSLSGMAITGIYLYGLRMDLSAAAYLGVVPFLLWFFNTLLPFSWAKRIVTAYSAVMLAVAALITTSDLQIYKIWGAKLNAQAISYLRFPVEALASMSSSPLFLLVALCAALTLAGYLLYRAMLLRLSFAAAPRSPVRLLARLFFFVVVSGMLVLAIRGGTGLAPMNPGFAYFSNNQFANHAALNTSWNLMYDLKHYFRHKNNQFHYMSAGEMHERVERLISASSANDTESVLSMARPDIVVIMLESWTADVIGALGAEKGIAPFFDQLAAQGVLFTDFYANGYRTAFGIAAVLSGFPSTPEGSILNRPNKMERLPTLAERLKANGYTTSFYYGGDTNFDDMNAFLVHSRFDTITGKSSFQAKDMNSKWGVHDNVLFDRVQTDLARLPEPFFSAMLTISSHEPFDVPMASVFKGNDTAQKFKNAVHYTDQSLKAFFAQAQRQPWFKNTLFVLVADHGCGHLSKSGDGVNAERYKIPLLLYGDVIKKQYRGTKNTLTGSQADIAATLLAQLRIKHDDFSWSNNLFNSHRTNFAYYNFAGGFGFVTPQRAVTFNAQSNMLVPNHPESAQDDSGEILKDGQAYLQNLYQNYSRF